MTKRTASKLRMNRETLRQINTSTLTGILGGYYTGPAPTQLCSNPYYDKNCSGWTLDCWTGTR